MRRRVTAVVLAGLVAILTTSTVALAQAKPKEKLTFQFAWIPSGKYAGFYLAKELGYYDSRAR